FGGKVMGDWSFSGAAFKFVVVNMIAEANAINDECLMANDERSPNDEEPIPKVLSFVIGISSFLRHSSFVLRHSANVVFAFTDRFECSRSRPAQAGSASHPRPVTPSSVRTVSRKLRQSRRRS